jgi:hypothetical protein
MYRRRFLHAVCIINTGTVPGIARVADTYYERFFFVSTPMVDGGWWIDRWHQRINENSAHHDHNHKRNQIQPESRLT